MSANNPSSHTPPNRKGNEKKNGLDLDPQELLVPVVEDFYAIEKVVGWKGEGSARRYLVQWSQNAHTPTTRPDNSWVRPSELCEESHREALALVKKDKKKLKEEAKASAAAGGPNQKKLAAKKKETDASGGEDVVDLTNENDSEATNKHPSGQAAGKPPAKRRKTSSNNTEVKAAPVTSQDEKKPPAKSSLAKRESGTRNGNSPRKKTRQRKNSRQDRFKLTDEEWKQQQLLKGNNIDLLEYQEVKRVHVHADNAREEVSALRRSGTPVVLTGFRGWPEFASRWLDDETEKLNIDQMVQDIGKEKVPIVGKNYSDRNPTENEMDASIFLKQYWHDMDDNLNNSEEEEEDLDVPYMQQWQFTASDEVQGILSCSDPAPTVLHQDLIKLWHEGQGNTYQYLFMGGKGTMSRMHQDPGGLDILIAPIIGEKECILAHRSDAEDFLYNLDSTLERLDLNKFPKTLFANVWKTVVKAGELLILPYDTYHQCRNIKPCLSYHRLHLDKVNLRGFVKTLIDGKAKELKHEEVIWNVTDSFQDQVDEGVDAYRSGNIPGDNEDIWIEGLKDKCDTLSRLRVVCLAIWRDMLASKQRKTWTYTPENWISLVIECDKTIHNYTHRDNERPPRIRQQNYEADAEEESDDDQCDEELREEYNGKWHLSPAFQEILDAMQSLETFGVEEDLVISDMEKLKVGDNVHLRLNNRKAEGTIEKIASKKAFLLSYDSLPGDFDEYQPFEKIRSLTSPNLVVTPNALRPAMANTLENNNFVRCTPSCGTKEAMEAKIVKSRTGTFYRVRIPLNDAVTITRWMDRDSFLEKIKKK